MPSSHVPTGKRPEFKQSKSAAWGWPRLVPVHEQHSRLPQENRSSASRSLGDHKEQQDPPPAMISTIISKLHAEENPPLSPVPGAADSSPTDERSAAEAVNDQTYDHVRDSLSSSPVSDHEARRVANPKAASSSSNSGEENLPRSKHGSVEGVAKMESPISKRGSAEDIDEVSSSASKHGLAEDVVEVKSPASQSGPVENTAEVNPLPSEYGPVEDADEVKASASEHGLAENAANEDDTEIPVAYDNTITDVPLKEEKPATPPTTPIPPVMDRVSVPSSSVPYYATPKIMIHKPSQSSEAENPDSRTIDEVLANDRRSLPQERTSGALRSSPDDDVNDEPPMESLSLKPIAWQVPKDQRVQKRKLYLRKVRNAAARKTILKATLGRQLAIPTKQMLRLLANGENLTIPDVSKQGVEAATMLVPQEAVGSVTGAVLLPQGIAGAVSDE